MDKKDYHAEGQKDQLKSRKDGWYEILISGGGSPNYKPPSNPKDAKEYKSGWDNAKKNRE